MINLHLWLLPLILGVTNINGAVIPITQAPYFVSVDYNNGGTFDGVLVDPGWVLVAGTSITWFTDDDWANHVTVRAGTARLSTGGQSLKVKNHTWHEKFNRYDYNVALLQLDGTFPASPSVATIKLGTTEPSSGSQITVTLFGSFPDDHSTGSDLQQFTVPVISRTACRIALQDDIDVTDRMVCGGIPMPPGGVCYGESGNPITQNGALVGIYATGVGCWQDKPAIYTNLVHPEIISFVQSTINST